jgi:adenylosuccinate synthase
MTVGEWSKCGKVSVLCDGAFGSTGKGAAAAWLARFCRDPVGIATCNSGANAGHTSIVDGWKFICYTLPTTGVLRPESRIYINAGSIIDLPSFEQEVEDCKIDRLRITVHPRASIITDAMKAAERIPENGPARIASTMHGVGQAIADKVMRRAPLAQGSKLPSWVKVEPLCLNGEMDIYNASIVLEIPQGAGLSLNHGYAYPYCTSRDAYVTAGLSDAGIHPSFIGPICMTMRTYPIRVGDSYNEQGELLGRSGPFYPDSIELDWKRDFPGIEPERTTVTKRMRRIASWSNQQYQDALELNRPTMVFLNFCNYLPSGTAFLGLLHHMQRIERKVGNANVHRIYGFGPAVEDVTDNLDAAVSWYDKREPTWNSDGGTHVDRQ